MKDVPVKWGYGDMLSDWNRMFFCVNIYVNTLLIQKSVKPMCCPYQQLKIKEDTLWFE